MGERFRAWMLSRRVDGCRISDAGDKRLRIVGEHAVGEVNFYDLAGGSEVVEMRISRAGDGEQVFFLHFMMEDLARARELFREMAEALEEMGAQQETPILLCRTCGVTTTMFAARMNEVSQALSLGYASEARPLDRALAERRDYAAVMLAPQVAHLRGEVAKAFPQAAVFEMPGKVFGSYDAAAGVRLVGRVLDRENTKSAGATPAGAQVLPVGEGLAWDGRVMAVSAVLGARLSSCEYRVYGRGELVLQGRADKRGFDLRDIEDLLAGVRLRGLDPATLGAVGIAVPGIIDGGRVSLPSHGIHDYDLQAHLEGALGTRVLLDDDANAAAAGVFSTQGTYRSVTFHREDFGHAGCGQGSIVDGRLVRGRKNFAGELNHLVGALRFSADPHDLAWTEAGLREVVSRFLLANICTFSPEAIYVDAWPATDMGELRAELLPFLGEEYMPELIPAPGLNECVLVGGLALCAQRLRCLAATRRWPRTRREGRDRCLPTITCTPCSQTTRGTRPRRSPRTHGGSTSTRSASPTTWTTA